MYVYIYIYVCIYNIYIYMYFFRVSKGQILRKSGIAKGDCRVSLKQDFPSIPMDSHDKTRLNLDCHHVAPIQ